MNHRFTQIHLLFTIFSNFFSSSFVIELTKVLIVYLPHQCDVFFLCIIPNMAESKVEFCFFVTIDFGLSTTNPTL